MGAFQVWRRLLWKECMEGRVVVLLTLLAPLVTFRIGLSFGSDNIARSLWIFPAAAGVHLAIALWGVRRGSSKRSGSEFISTHLPTSPAIEWLVSLLFPCVIIGLLGLWYGWLADPVWSLPEKYPLPLAGALDLVTTYAVCFLIAGIASYWAGLLVGVFRLIGGTLISAVDLNSMLDADTVGFAVRTLLGAILGSFLFAVLLRKKSPALRQLLTLASVLVVIFAPSVPAVTSILHALSLEKNQYKYAPSFGNYEAYSKDHSVFVRVRLSEPDKQGNRHYVMLMNDYRANLKRSLWLPGDVQILKALPGSRVYFGQRSKDGSGVLIREWSASKNVLRDIVTLPVKPTTFALVSAAISPDESAIALITPSYFSNDESIEQLSRDSDLWLLNVRRGSSEVLRPHLPNTGHNVLGWRDNKTIALAGEHGLYLIDILSHSVQHIQIECGEVAQQ